LRNDKQVKNIAKAEINKALRLFRPSYVEQHVDGVDHASYKKLSRDQIDQGVIALVLECNLSGGSVMDMDLYKLFRTYLWSPEARAEINAVVKYHGL
jgi:hypothetical protein